MKKIFNKNKPSDKIGEATSDTLAGIEKTTSEVTTSNKYDIDTGNLNVGRNFMWIEKLPLKFTVAIATLSILGSFGISIFTNRLQTQDREKMDYVTKMIQYNESIGKTVLNAPSGDSDVYNSLKLSESSLEKILKVMHDGGSFQNGGSVPKIEKKVLPMLKEVDTSWMTEQSVLDDLIGQQAGILKVKATIAEANKKMAALTAATADFQRIVQTNDPNNANASLETFVLVNRAQGGMNDLLAQNDSMDASSDSSNKGVMLADTLSAMKSMLDALKNGEITYNQKPFSDPAVVKALDKVETAFAALNEISKNSDYIQSQLAVILNAKGYAVDLQDITKTTDVSLGKLERAYGIRLSELGKYTFVIMGLFFVGIIALALVSAYFFDKEKKVENIAKELEKSQNNQAAMNLLLEQINPMGDGDFTNKIYVSDKFVTQIAEKVDATREVFADIVKKIKTTAMLVGENANNTDASSKNLLKISETQFEQIQNSINKISTITSEMDEVAQSTWIAQEESNQSKSASEEGQKLVAESIKKMDEIRNNIQESSKKIKKSSESAQAISEVTGLIQNITKQIEILALNAAIQAASSGDAGREFTVVAQEVQRLALDSKEATKQILDLIKEVQEDIGVAVASMEITTQEVVEGAKLTDVAGQALNKIGNLSKKVANSVAEASYKLEEKSSEIAKISIEMKDLQHTTTNSQKIVHVTAKQVEELNVISSELTGAVERYRV